MSGYEPEGRGFESLSAHHVAASFISLAAIFFDDLRALIPLRLLFPSKVCTANFRWGPALRFFGQNKNAKCKKTLDVWCQLKMIDFSADAGLWHQLLNAVLNRHF